MSRLDSDRFTTGVEYWRIPCGQDLPTESSWIIHETEVVWYRKVILPDALDSVRSFIRQETEGLLDSILFQYRACRWINPRDGIARARSKIAQLHRAKLTGFRIPDTLVTTSIKMLESFADQHHGEIVAKPMQAQVVGSDQQALVIGTRRLSPEYYTSAISGAPCYVQERLRIRSEIRVVVFGERIFAFRLTAQEKADDLKQLPLSKIRHEPCTLDSKSSEKIQTFMSFYGLEFGAFDFVEVDEDELIFLELNPNGQWLWLQYMTGENLLDPFIDFLCA